VELRLAREFINVNELNKAEQHLKAVQSASPADQGLWAVWADLAMKSQSQEKMFEIAENGLKELDSQPWDFMPIATELFIRCGRLDLAAERISEMNQKDIEPRYVTFLEGLLAAEEGHLFKAIDYWQESMGLGNKSPRMRLALSSALSRVGNIQSAFRHLLTLVSENPGYVAGHLELARLFAQVGNWAQSSGYAATAKQLSPENPEASLLYLQAHMQLRAEGSAVEIAQTLQDLEKMEGNLPELKLLKFQLALQQNNFKDARALVTQLKEENPSQIKTTMAEVRLLIAQDKTEEAILILEDALVKFPQAVEPVGYLAALYDRQDNKEKCESYIKEALEGIDQPVNKRELGLLLAKYYVQWNQNDKVYSLLNTLVQKLPEDILLKRRLLFCEQVINDPERAQELVNDIESLVGKEDWQWRYEQARIWFLSDDFEARYAQIVSLLQENIQINPNDQVSRIALAAAYDRSGELQLAISTYREALNRSPDNLHVIIPFIDVLSKSMEFDEVDRLLKHVGNSQQDLYKPQLQQFQYDSYLRHGQLSSASNMLQDFISNNPNDPNNQEYRFVLASLKSQQGKYDEAKELLDKLKAQSPDSLPFTYAQVRLCFLQNKSNEALSLCDEMVNNLNNASAYIFRARTNASFKQTDKAREDFEHAAAIEPNNVEVWMIKSEFYRSIGRLDKAIEDINKARLLAPDNIRIQKQAISLLSESDDPNDVLKREAIFDEALKSNPDDTDLRLFKAKSLLMERTAEATKEAEQILQQITDDQPEISQAWELLGKIYLIRRKQTGKAKDTILRGLSHSPNDKALLLLKARAYSC